MIEIGQTMTHENGKGKTESFPHKEVEFTFDPLEQLEFNIAIDFKTLTKEDPKKK